MGDILQENALLVDDDAAEGYDMWMLAALED
jgi:hypothetical protein